MYFPYFGKFSYYGIFRENNTILDICFLFKALERRKKSNMRGTSFYVIYI